MKNEEKKKREENKHEPTSVHQAKNQANYLLTKKKQRKKNSEQKQKQKQKLKTE